MPEPPTRTPRRGAPGDLYLSRPPWDTGAPQPAFAALAGSGAFRGRVLDAGCGTGEHTLLAAVAGLDATGTDLSESLMRPRRAGASEGAPRENKSLRLP
jgi:SAM-dependent methyltransferase